MITALLILLEKILYVLMAIPVGYMLIFTLAAMFQRKAVGRSSNMQHRSFVVLIPAYRCDKVILKTAQQAAQQNYPKDKFRVIVIADGLQQQTLDSLRAIPVEVVEVKFQNSSKAKSLQYTMEQLGNGAADCVTILDADNLVYSNYLQQLDAAFAGGCRAIQAHRTAKNRDTATAVLDAASEEINNTIYRKGHNALGLSSALIGSGMAFEYGWFQDNIFACATSGEDKELELMLMLQKVHVDYMEHILVLDEKTASAVSYGGQRRRWIAAQYYSLVSALKDLPKALASGNLSYMDKALQWCFPPRMLMMGVIALMTLAGLFFRFIDFGRWFGLLALMTLCFYAGIPKEQRDAKLLKALGQIPQLIIITVKNMFHLGGTKDNFIHTEHNFDR